MKYSILTKLNVADDCPEELYEEQQAKLEIFGIDDKEYTCHFFNSVFFNEQTEIMTVNDAIECLAIKDGVDLVMYDNGNIGYVAYYNGNENGFEIIDREV